MPATRAVVNVVAAFVSVVGQLAPSRRCSRLAVPAMAAAHRMVTARTRASSRCRSRRSRRREA